MTPQELWKNICQEAKNYFDFSLEWYVSDTPGTWQAGGPLTTQGAEQRGEGSEEKGWELLALARVRRWLEERVCLGSGWRAGGNSCWEGQRGALGAQAHRSLPQ